MEVMSHNKIRNQNLPNHSWVSTLIKKLQIKSKAENEVQNIFLEECSIDLLKIFIFVKVRIKKLTKYAFAFLRF